MYRWPFRRLHSWQQQLQFLPARFWEARPPVPWTVPEVRFEIGAIKFVYRLEVGEIGEENGRLDDVSEIQSLCPEHGCDVFHYPPRLCINVAGNDFASLWIQRDLAGTKDEIANTNGLRVRPDCRGGLRGGDDFLHGAMLAAASAMSSDLSCRGEHGESSRICQRIPKRNALRVPPSLE